MAAECRSMAGALHRFLYNQKLLEGNGKYNESYHNGEPNREVHGKINGNQCVFRGYVHGGSVVACQVSKVMCRDILGWSCTEI